MHWLSFDLRCESGTCTYIHYILVYQLCIILGHQLYWLNSQPDSPGTNYGRCVDIFAPGQWIISASHM